MYGQGFGLFAIWGYVISHERGGIVELNPKLLSDLFGEPIDSVATLVNKLCSPDDNSRSKAQEGRRLVRIGQYAYQVVNAAEYAKMATEADRRCYLAQKQREHRAQNPGLSAQKSSAYSKVLSAVASGKLADPSKLCCSICGHNAQEYHHPNGYDKEHSLEVVPVCIICHKKIHRQHSSTLVNKNQPSDADADSASEAKAEKIYCPNFIAFWNKYPRKEGKGKAWESWQAKKPPIEQVLATLEKYKRSEQWKDLQFVPMPATWLNQSRWEDEPKRGRETTQEQVARMEREGTWKGFV